MAVVLPSEDNDFFSSSTLRRSHSQSKFMSKPSQSFHTSASTSRINDAFHEAYHEAYHQRPTHIVPNSSPSSAPSSPRTLQPESADPSYSSTPATNFSLDGQCEDDIHIQPGDNIFVSEFDHNPYFGLLDDLEPPPSPQTSDSYTVSPTEQDTSAITPCPESSDTLERAEDDTAVERHPTQHVDYLSHNWREEDIWSSWRYIVSKKGEYINSRRLENASWRTWMKSKYKLRTVSPETLNWLKDCDVTWLYGPLQTRQGELFASDAEQGSSTLSRCDSFVNKKPILKKRSMSEIMLQRSLSSSSLLKQATAAVQAQQKDGASRIGRPILRRATTDFVTFPFSSRRKSRDSTSILPSAATSGISSPSSERKHIHFDEQVQQCIAVEIKGYDEDEDEVDHYHWNYGDDSDSDDGAIMMKRTKTSKKPVIPQRRSPVSTPSESKTIAMLPSTTLKYREDSPAPETSMMQSTGSPRGSTLSSSSSQETLRPSKPSGSFFAGDNDEEKPDGQVNSTPASSSANTTPRYERSTPQRPTPTSLAEEPVGMRRTESGMFMPYEDGDVQPNDGIISRVIDTVNTARDIAHVIWNVGWRR